MSLRAVFLVFFFYCFSGGKAQEDATVKALLNTGDKLAATAQYDSALVLADQAIVLSEKQHGLHDLALAFKLKGYCMYFKGSYPAALEFYQKTEKLGEENGFKDVLLSLHNLLGTFYKKQNKLKEALAEFEAGERLAVELRDPVQQGNFKSDIGLVLELQGDLAHAISNFKEAIGLFKENNNLGSLSYALDYLGEAYANQGDFKAALDAMMQCLELRKRSPEKAPLAINLNNIGELYMMQKNYEAALPYLVNSEKISASIRYNDLRNHTLSLMAKCNYQLGDFKTASELYEQAATLKDSIYNDKNARLVNEMEARYQNEKKQLQIENLNRQNELKEEKLSKQRTTIILIGVAVLLCAAGIVVVIRSNQKIRKAHRIISLQKHIVEEKQREILDSIYYARRIQRSLLTSERYIARHLARMSKKA